MLALTNREGMRSGARAWFATLCAVAFGVLIALGVWWRYQEELGAAKAHYHLSSGAAAAAVAEAIDRKLGAAYRALTAIALLPALRATPDAGPESGAAAAAAGIAAGLGGEEGASAIYIVVRGARVAKGSEGLMRYYGAADGAFARPLERARVAGRDEVDAQLEWFERHFPRYGSSAAAGYPAVSGMAPDGAWLVYSVPLYDAGGAMRGLVAAVFASAHLQNVLFPEYYVIRNIGRDFTIVPEYDGAWRRSAAAIAAGRPDEQLIYSEVLALHARDARADWLLWAGEPDELFWARADVRSAAHFLIAGGAFAALASAALLVFFRLRCRHEETVEQHSVELAQRVAQQTRELRASRDRRGAITQELLVSEERLQAIMDASADAIVTFDKSGVIEDMNPAAEHLFGCRSAEAVGAAIATAFSLAGPEGRAADVVATLARLAEEETGVFREFDIRTGRGDSLSVELAVAEIRAEAAGLYVLIAHDVTRRKQFEREIREAQRRLRSIIDGVADGIVTAGAGGVIESGNPAAERILGYAPGELVGLPVAALSPSLRDAAAAASGLPPVSEARETLIVRQDGAAVPVELMVRELPVEGGGHLVMILFRDISERRDAERALREANENLEVLVAARTQALTIVNEKLKRTRDEALVAARAKSDFLAMMSHEIRTPFNGVLGMLSLLRGTHLEEAQREYVEVAHSSADALLSLLNDILDLSKMDAGKAQIEALDFDCRKTVEDIVRLLGESARAKGVALTCSFAPGIPQFVTGDPTRLRQVLTNLMSNAIKFTERGEVVVEVDVVESGEQRIVVRFRVRDTGIGMSPDQAQIIFEPFSQADGSITRRFGGTGLGLAICKRLVGLLGGTIGVESELGKGSVFAFTVPLRKGAPRARPELREDLRGVRLMIIADAAGAAQLQQLLRSRGGHADASADVAAAVSMMEAAAGADMPHHVVMLDKVDPRMEPLDYAALLRANERLAGARIIVLTGVAKRGDGARAKEIGVAGYLTKPVAPEEVFKCIATVLGYPDAAAAPLVTRHALAELAPERVRILIAEDNKVNQKVALAVLGRLGYQADVVENGAQALDAVAGGRYDIVLMDCQMPVMDGYQATARIRAAQGDARTPIIALTANAAPEDVERCLRAGMDDYLPKPIRQEDLQAKIAQWAGAARRARGAAGRI